jgi:hypothetical protein
MTGTLIMLGVMAALGVVAIVVVPRLMTRNTTPRQPGEPLHKSPPISPWKVILIVVITFAAVFVVAEVLS